jgi:NADPH:quinone reductase
LAVIHHLLKSRSSGVNPKEISMTPVIRMEACGGPEVLQLAQVDLPPPGPGELRVRQSAIGVNYHDVYVRSGLYKTLALPGVPGIEAVGVVDALGEGVSGFAAGDRIGYVTGGYGAYAQARNLAADRALRLPDALTDQQAAASLLKALTVAMLLQNVRKLERGETILVHAAAGGVGQLLCQWAAHAGATVIGTVGSDAKADIARARGAHHVINYRSETVADRVKDLTGGPGVPVVYDSVGADTFSGSIESLDFLGHLVNFGQSSGPVAPFTPAVLAGKSLTLTRPILFHYVRSAHALQAMARDVFALFSNGVLTPVESIALPLSQAAQAHMLLEARQSPGGVVLLP